MRTVQLARVLAVTLLLMAVALAGCASGDEMASISDAPKTVRVTSSAFAQGQPIPKKFTCDGDDVSPALSVSGQPTGTKSVALIMDDPDAPRGTWTHWTVWNLPASTSSLPEDAGVKSLGARQGRTDSGSAEYHGPCPPGGTHRYFFKVYAVNDTLGLAEGAPRKDLEAALAGKVLAWGEVMGTYSR